VPRYVLTGAPGAGKTAILRLLEARGHDVVEEAATDVIALEHALGRATPWLEPGFPDAIVALQRTRQLGARDEPDRPTFYDRSPVCTLALCEFLGVEPSGALLAEVDRVVAGSVYERTVFVVRGLGVIEPTAARRIRPDEALAFERCHVEAYGRLGFELVDVPRAPLPARVARVEDVLANLVR
jgi:predicted ATPase